MINENLIPLTQQAYDKYKEEYDHLTKTARADVIEKIGVAKSYGDLSENSEYDAAKEEQSKIENRIAEIEFILKNHVIIDETAITTDQITIGSFVKIVDIELGVESEYQIVDAVEADPLSGKISKDSPVGKALMGCKAGVEVAVEAPVGVIRVFVKEISNVEFA